MSREFISSTFAMRACVGTMVSADCKRRGPPLFTNLFWAQGNFPSLGMSSRLTDQKCVTQCLSAGVAAAIREPRTHATPCPAFACNLLRMLNADVTAQGHHDCAPPLPRVSEFSHQIRVPGSRREGVPKRWCSTARSGQGWPLASNSAQTLSRIDHGMISGAERRVLVGRCTW